MFTTDHRVESPSCLDEQLPPDYLRIGHLSERIQGYKDWLHPIRRHHVLERRLLLWTLAAPGCSACRQRLPDRLQGGAHLRHALGCEVDQGYGALVPNLAVHVSGEVEIGFRLLPAID
jgi:hypothetical protein